MLKIQVPMSEALDKRTREFIPSDLFEIELEHSLVSLSKWESEFEKPFLTVDEKSVDEIIGYIKAMTLTPDVPEKVFSNLSEENISQINEYIGAKMTATWFREGSSSPGREIITSELVYYWMFSYGIPKECEKWHLNRLFTLLKVFSEKNKPPKQMSRAEVMRQHRDLNAQRRAQLGISG